MIELVVKCRAWFLCAVALLSATVELGADHPDPDVDALASALSSVELQDRREAAYTLAKLGPSALPAMDALIVGLSDRDEQVWMQSAMAIARIGPEAEAAIDALVECFGDRDGQRRYRAAWAVSQIGPAAIPRLIDAAHHDYSVRRIAALDAMGWMMEHAEPLIPSLEECLDDSGRDIRQQAADSLRRLAPAPATRGSLLKALRSHDDRVRDLACKGLAEFDGVSPAVRERLVELTQDRSADVRSSALIAIVALHRSGMRDDGSHGADTQLDQDSREDPDATDVLELIARSVADEETQVRGASVLALRKMGDRAVEAVPMLVELLSSDQEQTRSSAAFVLASLGRRAEGAIDALIEALKRQSSGSSEISSSISRIGTAAVAPLLRASSDPEQSPGDLASALSGIGPCAVKPLVAALEGDSVVERVTAATALAEMDPTPDAARQALGACLGDPSEDLRCAAAKALARCEQVGEETSTRLVQLTGDPSGHVRAAALSAVARVGRDANQVRGLLIGGLNDPHPEVRRQAMDAVARLGGAAVSALAEITRALSDPDAAVRMSAVSTLGELGEAAAESLPEVIRLVQDNDSSVRAAAAAAIGDLGADPRAAAALSESLDDDHDAVVIAALSSLKKVASAASECSDSVGRLMTHSNVEIRAAAIKTYPTIEKDTTKSVPRLIERLRDEDWTVRRDTCEALGALGPGAVASVPVLFKMLNSDEDQDAARGALRAIDAADARALPALIEGLESDDRRIRYYATFLIGKIGADAKEALPILRRLRDETDSRRARESLQRAIDKIAEES